MRPFLDLIVRLRDPDPVAGTLRVEVLPSPGVGETPEAVTVDYRPEALARPLGDLENKRISSEDLVALGVQLADWLLPPGPVRTLFEGARRQAGQDGGVRLRLVISDPDLARIPWEYACLPQEGQPAGLAHFLALNPQVSIVRHVPMTTPHPALAPTREGRIRVLAAFVNTGDLRPLDLERERHVVASALQDLNVEGVQVTWTPLENPTLQALQAALLAGTDIFHFAGHGAFQATDFDPQTGRPVGQGYLVLRQDEMSDRAAHVPAEAIAPLLQQANVRLAVLGACESGRQDGTVPWHGVAPALVQRGIPAVLAMQYEVKDDHAVAFMQLFYSALAAGLSVDEAVAAGRLAMLGLSGPEDVEWGVPVLFMRATDGVLFPRPPEKPARHTQQQFQHVFRQTVQTVEKGGKVVGVRAKRVRGSTTILVEQVADRVDGTLIGGEFDEL